jgi:glycosyltransferase 2 family protein
LDGGAAPPAPGRRFPAWLGWLLRLAVLAGFLAYILHGLDFSRVGETLRKLPASAVLAGLALLWCGQFLQALRWKTLLRDPSVRLLDCLAFICLGSSLNLVSPSGLLSDGTIAYWMGRRNQAVLKSMSTLLASRFIGVASMLILFAIALPGHTWVFRKLALGWAPGKAVFPLLALVSLAVIAFLARNQKARILALVHQALPALRSPRHLLLAVVLSVGIQLTQFGMQAVGYHVLEIPVGFLDILFFAPVMTFLGMIPMSIGGIGVREGLSIFFFTLLPGVGKEQLLAHAGYGYILMLGMALVNLLFAFWVLGKPKPGDRPATGR